MGIQTESVLIVGWLISYDCLLQYLEEMGAKSCSDDYQCICGNDCCWGFDLEEGFKIVVTFPYYDCDQDDCNIYLSMKRAREGMTVKQMAAELVAILNDTEYMERAQKLAAQLGVDPSSEPKFFSEYSVT